MKKQLIVAASLISIALAASHVLKALGLTLKQMKESIRITLGKNTTEKEIKRAAEIINKTVKQLIN